MRSATWVSPSPRATPGSFRCLPATTTPQTEAAMQPIVPSRELIRRTIETQVAYTLSRMNVLARLNGNPVGIAHRKAGNGWALMARHLPVPSFNAVIGLEAGDASEIEALLQWYRDNDVTPQIEIVPGFEDATLARELVRLGSHHSC